MEPGVSAADCMHADSGLRSGQVWLPATTKPVSSCSTAVAGYRGVSDSVAGWACPAISRWRAFDRLRLSSSAGRRIEPRLSRRSRGHLCIRRRRCQLFQPHHRPPAVVAVADRRARHALHLGGAAGAGIAAGPRNPRATVRPRSRAARRAAVISAQRSCAYSSGNGPAANAPARAAGQRAVLSPLHRSGNDALYSAASMTPERAARSFSSALAGMNRDPIERLFFDRGGKGLATDVGVCSLQNFDARRRSVQGGAMFVAPGARARLFQRRLHRPDPAGVRVLASR